MYVGKAQNFDLRKKGHLKANDHNKPKCQWFKDMRDIEQTPIIQPVYTNLTDKQASKIERYIIKILTPVFNSMSNPNKPKNKPVIDKRLYYPYSLVQLD